MKPPNRTAVKALNALVAIGGIAVGVYCFHRLPFLAAINFVLAGTNIMAFALVHTNG